MKKIKLGLIGLGRVGKIHLQNCLKLKSARLIAASDISKKALGLAKKMGVKKTFIDYKQLLEDSSIDAVIIALPTHLHAPCARNAAEAGKPIFLEKPLSRNVTEGKKIVSIAKRNGVKLMVGYPMRFSSSFRCLKEKIQSGILGEVQIANGISVGSGPLIHRAEGSVPLPVPSWWFEKELVGGGALIDVGSHLVNLFRWYFGEITEIKSYLGYRFNMNLEDHATCIVKFASGTICTIHVGWFSRESLVRVELLGTVKNASAYHLPQNKIVTALQLLTTNSCKYYLPYLRELEYFVQCVTHNLPPSPSGSDALKDLEAISLAYQPMNQVRLK